VTDDPREIVQEIVAAHGRRLERARRLQAEGKEYVTDDEVDELLIAWLEARLRLVQHTGV
jgi:hypothetical protein